MTTLHLEHTDPQIIMLRDDASTTSFRTDAETASFPWPDATFDRIEVLDVIEHVMDEEVWLAEIARVLKPGGSARVQVPLRGLTSWFDGLNIYRYAVDVLGRGHDPVETKPVGWHRQYKPVDIRDLIERAGLIVSDVQSHSIGLGELPTLGLLVAGDMIGSDPQAEVRARNARRGFDNIDRSIPAGPCSRRLLVSASRPA